MPRDVHALGAGSILFLAALAAAPSGARADVDCARVRPEGARASCEAVVRAVRDDDAAAFVAALADRVQRIDRHLRRGERSARLDRAALTELVGASPRAFLRLGRADDDEVRVVHHVRQPHGDVPSFVRIEIRGVDTDTVATLALGGDGWTIDLVIVRPRHARD